jgi:predicted GNAT family acetyltransferase
MLADTPVAYVETVADAEASPPERWSSRAVERSTGDDSTVLVAETAAGAFVGTAGGFTDRPDHTIVVGVYVTPAYRGTGLIDRLIEAVADWSLAAGRRQLLLEVAQENPRALAAYRRLGFTPTGLTGPHPLYPGITELELARPARRVAPASAR